MKHPFRDLGLILALAAFWAVSGYVVGLSIELFLGLLGLTPPTLTVILASVNVIIGMLLFKGITHDPTAERIFFEGPEPEGEGDLRIGCLWGLPLTLLLIGLQLLVVTILLRVFFK